MSRASSLYVAAQPSDLRWADCDGVFALHHRPSGKTHFVNDATRLLLTQVLDRPAGLEDAARRLADLQDDPAADGFAEHVAGLVARLEELGLVHRC